ncbi:hypothetical protein CPI22_06095, partial [Moraxella catarrhalis]|nr:hypothetical protein [Moraxella catarrhalis]
FSAAHLAMSLPPWLIRRARGSSQPKLKPPLQNLTGPSINSLIVFKHNKVFIFFFFFVLCKYFFFYFFFFNRAAPHDLHAIPPGGSVNGVKERVVCPG